jgi:hypothetical protein
MSEIFSNLYLPGIKLGNAEGFVRINDKSHMHGDIYNVLCSDSLFHVCQIRH